MTKKNDETVTSSPTSVFSFPPPRANGGSYPGRNKLLTHLELSGSRGRISAWVESMKASSPKSTITLCHDNEIYNTWMKQHPSALSKFDQITAAARGKKLVVFLDYDGTLSPIVDDPDRAFMSDAMRDSVKELATCFPTAIVSGRAINKVYNFVGLGELYYAGSHGMDIRGPTIGINDTEAQAKTVLFQPAIEFLTMIDEVLEIRPIIEWDKGRALEFLLETLGFADSNDVLPLYIGDDRTDEDAFKVLRDREQGFGILVSKFRKTTRAFYSLKDPTEVMDFLCRLVEWKRLSQKTPNSNTKSIKQDK